MKNITISIAFIFLFLIITTVPINAQETILNTTVTFKGTNLTAVEIIKTIQKSFPIAINADNLKKEKTDLNLEQVELKEVFNEVIKNSNLNYKILGNQIYIDNNTNIDKIVKAYKEKFDHKYVVFDRLSREEIKNKIKEHDLNIYIEYVNNGVFNLKGLNKEIDNIIPKLLEINKIKKQNSKYQYIKVKNKKEAKKYIKKNYPEIKILKNTNTNGLILFITEEEKLSLLNKI